MKKQNKKGSIMDSWSKIKKATQELKSLIGSKPEDFLVSAKLNLDPGDIMSRVANAFGEDYLETDIPAYWRKEQFKREQKLADLTQEMSDIDRVVDSIEK